MLSHNVVDEHSPLSCAPQANSGLQELFDDARSAYRDRLLTNGSIEGLITPFDDHLLIALYRCLLDETLPLPLPENFSLHEDLSSLDLLIEYAALLAIFGMRRNRAPLVILAMSHLDALQQLRAKGLLPGCFLQSIDTPFNGGNLLDVLFGIRSPQTSFETLFTQVTWNPSELAEVTLPMDVKKRRGYTLLMAKRGVASGLFSFVRQKIGIVNAGPSFFPLGTSFGITGCAYDNENNSYAYSSTLGDVGWLNIQSEDKEESCDIAIRCVAPKEMYPYAFSLFIKGGSLDVDGYGLVAPRSLEKYQGDTQDVVIRDEGICITISELSHGEMQVVPLAGGDHFGSADFMVSYVLTQSRDSLSLSIS